MLLNLTGITSNLSDRILLPSFQTSSFISVTGTLLFFSSLYGRKYFWVTNGLLVLSFTGIWVVSYGYLMISPGLYASRGAQHIGMEILTLLCAILLWISIAGFRKDNDIIIRLLFQDDFASKVCRWVMVGTFLLTLLMGWIMVYLNKDVANQDMLFHVDVSLAITGVIMAVMGIFIGIQLKIRETGYAETVQNYLRTVTNLENQINNLHSKLEGDVKVCAWTKKVKYKGKWVNADVFLAEHFGMPITHGISEDAMEQFLKEYGETGAGSR